jgi:hypothetical protein
LILQTACFMDKKAKQELEKERKRIRAEITDALSSAKPKPNITADDIIDLVYSAGERWGEKAHLHVQKELFAKLSKVKSEDVQMHMFDLLMQCWNYFPHKDMDDKCPFELVQEQKKKWKKKG